MALTSAELKALITVASSKTNAGFQPTKQGPDTQSFVLVPDVTVFNESYQTQIVLSAGTNTTVDLQSFTALDGTSVTLTKVIGIILIPTGSGVKLEPGASNGLVWFFAGTSPSITVPVGGCIFYGQPTATVVDGTHKTLKFSESGGASLACNVVIVGGL